MFAEINKKSPCTLNLKLVVKTKLMRILSLIEYE